MICCIVGLRLGFETRYCERYKVKYVFLFRIPVLNVDEMLQSFGDSLVRKKR